jgi:hypothetical protein
MDLNLGASAGLSNFIPQNNHFVVFEAYFEHQQRQQKQNGPRRRWGLTDEQQEQHGSQKGQQRQRQSLCTPEDHRLQHAFGIDKVSTAHRVQVPMGIHPRVPFMMPKLTADVLCIQQCQCMHLFPFVYCLQQQGQVLQPSCVFLIRCMMLLSSSCSDLSAQLVLH